jgi:hypothetical protein
MKSPASTCKQGCEERELAFLADVQRDAANELTDAERREVVAHWKVAPEYFARVFEVYRKWEADERRAVIEN